MRIILGLDPGSLITGYGVISFDKNKFSYIDSGCIRTGGGEMAGRLKILYESVKLLMEKYRPMEVAIEKVFMHKNADSALKLGQARGAVIAAAVHYDARLSEYTAREVKLAVVGYGAAEKIQVQAMVKQLLKLNKTPQADAADALAIALCHTQQSRILVKRKSI
jgi:crossover junction endodeoxyribonuclease RuvC